LGALMGGLGGIPGLSPFMLQLINPNASFARPL